MKAPRLEDIYNTALWYAWAPYYQQPHRHYHVTNHPIGMFQTAKEHGVKLTNAQSLAIMFHDAVWLPGCTQNEELSAEIMAVALHDAISIGIVKEADVVLAKQIIICTKDHVAKIKEAKVVIDLDLYGLATDYWKNGALIRKEFIQLTDNDYNKGRTVFLTKFLKKKQLFYTSTFAQYEERARKNLKMDLEAQKT